MYNVQIIEAVTHETVEDMLTKALNNPPEGMTHVQVTSDVISTEYKTYRYTLFFYSEDLINGPGVKLVSAR